MILKDSNIFWNNEGRKALILGENCDVGFGTQKTIRIHAYSKFAKNIRVDCEEVGSYTFINENVSIRNCKKIGNFCAVGPGVHIGVIEHPTEALSISDFFYGKRNWDWTTNGYKWEKTISGFKRKALIELGSDVWIGANAIIMPGVKIGDGAIIASNAVVTKDVPPFAIVGGVPAHIIRYRFSQEIIDELLELKWWNYDPEIVNGTNISNVNKNLLHCIRERINTTGKLLDPLVYDFFPVENKIIKIEKNKKYIIYDSNEKKISIGTISERKATYDESLSILSLQGWYLPDYAFDKIEIYNHNNSFLCNAELHQLRIDVLNGNIIYGNARAGWKVKQYIETNKIGDRIRVVCKKKDVIVKEEDCSIERISKSNGI